MFQNVFNAQNLKVRDRIYNLNEHISHIFSNYYSHDKIFQHENNIDMNVSRRHQN